jgi:putative DNA primase/helicase
MSDAKDLERAVEESLREDGQLIVPAPAKPLAVARQFLEEHHADERHETLIYHRGDFFTWAETHWLERDADGVESALYRWLENAFYWKPTKDGPTGLASFDPSKQRILNVVHALGRAAYVAARLDPPMWLDRADGATEYVAMQNGLLHMPTRRLHAHTPLFFSPFVLPYAYDPDAPRPTRWLQFVEELWGADEEMISTLCEVMGYILGGETSQQKIFLFVGPTRSGKGTTARVLQALLGMENVAGPTLSGLSTQFGMSELICKPLATISDARLNPRSDSTLAVERLLSISGEDVLSVQRKFKPDWIGRLPTRFLILTNELPQFADASGTIAGRFIILTLTRSFYDEEDPGLTARLIAEAPGIFNWALEGLDRLRERGHFVQPTASTAALQQLRDLASPVSAFVRDRCKVGPDEQTLKTDLWNCWKEWCDIEGARAGTNAILIRNLRAAYPNITPGRPEDAEGKRVHVLYGISLALVGTPDISDGDAEVGVPSGVEPAEDLAQPSRASGVSGVDPSVFRRNSRGDPGETHQAADRQHYDDVFASVRDECLTCGNEYLRDERYPERMRCPECADRVVA